MARAAWLLATLLQLLALNGRATNTGDAEAESKTATAATLLRVCWQEGEDEKREMKTKFIRSWRRSGQRQDCLPARQPAPAPNNKSENRN